MPEHTTPGNHSPIILRAGTVTNCLKCGTLVFEDDFPDGNPLCSRCQPKQLEMFKADTTATTTAA